MIGNEQFAFSSFKQVPSYTVIKACLRNIKDNSKECWGQYSALLEIKILKFKSFYLVPNNLVESN